MLRKKYLTTLFFLAFLIFTGCQTSEDGDGTDDNGGGNEEEQQGLITRGDVTPPAIESTWPESFQGRHGVFLPFIELVFSEDINESTLNVSVKDGVGELLSTRRIRKHSLYGFQIR